MALISAALGQDQESAGRPQSLAFPGAALFNDRPSFLTGVAVNHADAAYYEGNVLSVQFRSEVESHLYLLYHQADGTAVLLFPNKARPSSRLAARQQVTVPAAGDDFRFRIRPPFGPEVLQVLAAERPLRELETIAESEARTPRIEPEVFPVLVQRLAAEPGAWSEHRVLIHTYPASAARSSAPAARCGLFIGIGAYQRADVASPHVELRHSAEVMHDLMLQHGQLDPQRTRLVCDEQATKANLRSWIVDWLPQVSRPGDTVFLYFSGHAGQLPTSDPSEPDGLDEALGPYDLEGGRAGETRDQALARFRETNITDDTLAAWLTSLQGRQVVLILDTCFSGGVAEGKSFGSTFWRDQAARVKDITQVNTLVLSSCAADEQSLFEGTRNQTMWFTYCLTEAIEAAAGRGPLTVQDAFQVARRRMRTLIEQGNAPREQEPTMTDRVLLPVLLVP